MSSQEDECFAAVGKSSTDSIPNPKEQDQDDMFGKVDEDLISVF